MGDVMACFELGEEGLGYADILDCYKPTRSGLRYQYQPLRAVDIPILCAL